MTSKVFWMDTETTGINPSGNGLIQLAGIVEIGGDVVEEIDLKISPFPGDVIDDSALEVSGTTREDLAGYMDPKEAHKTLVDKLSFHVSKFDKKDKLVIAGYNVAFDDMFLRSFFQKNNDKYYGSMFFNVRIDVASFVAEALTRGVRLENYKLATICESAQVSLDDAHDAMWDIRATRELYNKLKSGEWGTEFTKGY